MEENNERRTIEYIMNFIQKTETVILANGSYPSNDIPLDILSKASYVVCCDGAANRYIENGFIPDVIIGDGDSLNEKYRYSHASLIKRISEQETNDQTKAVRFCLAQGKRQIAILGATGKREDHTLGNISLLIDYARMGAETRIYTDYGVFIPCKDKCVFNSTSQQQISIINFTAKNFKAQGLLYPIYDFTNWWQGTLNECTGDTFTIEAQGEYLLFANYANK